MIKLKHLCLALSALLAIPACTEHEDSITPLREDEVRITTRIGGMRQTRSPQLDPLSGYGNFQSGDVLNLGVYPEGQPWNEQVNRYVMGETKLSWSKDIISAIGTSPQYTFYGWYCADSTFDARQDFEFDLTQARDPDLLLAPPVTVTGRGSVNLAFKHAMHQLKIHFNLTGFWDDVSELTVKPVNMNACARIDARLGTVQLSPASDRDGDYKAQSVTPGTGEWYASFILPPQELVTGAEWIEVTLQPYGEKLTFKVPARIENNATGETPALNSLNSGETLAVYLTLRRLAVHSVAIEMSGCTISDWNEGSTYNEEMAMLDEWSYNTVDLSTLTEPYVINDDKDHYFIGTGRQAIRVTGGNPTIRLKDVTLQPLDGEANVISIAGNASATIHVSGNCVVESRAMPGSAGIYVEKGSSLTITGDSRDDALTAKGFFGGCGIGGYRHNISNEKVFDAGDITIRNVTVYAHASGYGTGEVSPAIGSVGNATCGTITIDNATVYAYGTTSFSEMSSGIGCGTYLHGNPSSTPTVIIQNRSEVHAHRGMDADETFLTDYIGWSYSQKYSTPEAAGTCNFGTGGSATNSTVYCYTLVRGASASRADEVREYDENGGCTVRDATLTIDSNESDAL